tara:strand:- start:208 stop:486 length:279 start_codon:yes stop_codon:yes gene_type:complete
MHHLPSKIFSKAFFAPECSVPAIGCPGKKFETSLILLIVDLLKIFFTEPVSVTIFFLVINGKILSKILLIELTGVQIKIISLFEIFSSIFNL